MTLPPAAPAEGSGPASQAGPGPARAAALMAGIVVGAGFLFNFVARGVIDTFTVFLLPLEAEFGWQRSTLTGVYATYLVAAGLASPASGAVLERWGPRATYGGGLVALILGMAGASRADSLWQFYLFHGVFGGIAASGLGIVPSSVLIGRWFDRNLSIAMAIAYAGLGSGILVIVPIAQRLVEAGGWRGAYRGLAMGLVVLVPLVLVLPWGRIRRGDPRIMAARARAAAAAAPPAGADGSARIPVGWTIRTAMRRAEFWLLVQCFFFTACASYSVVVQTVAFLISEGFPPLDAALAFGFSGMLSIIGVLGAGWLAARWGFRMTATLSFAATLVGVLALAGFATFHLGALVWLHVVAFGLSQGARGPIVATLCSRIFANGASGSIFGAIFMAMSFGSALGAWITGFLHDLTGDYRPAFLFAILSVLGAVAPFWYSRRLVDPGPLPPPNGDPR